MSNSDRMIPRGYEHPQDRPRLQPIVRPDAPRWITAFNQPYNGQGVAFAFALAVVAVGGFALLSLAMAGMAGVSGVLGGLGAVVGAGSLAVAGVMGRRAMGSVVSSWSPGFEGVPIEGRSLELLVDIQSRFEWAKKMFEQVPSGIRWDDVRHDVNVLLWGAAEHSAQVSALDVELGPLAWADAGTPQAARLHELTRRRDEHDALLRNIQREADALAREATNAATAAKIALSRTGSMFDLRLVLPTGAGLAARGTLYAARARLALLAEVWSEIDETGIIDDERFAAMERAAHARELEPAPAPTPVPAPRPSRARRQRQA